jgi:hypothetical protein
LQVVRAVCGRVEEFIVDDLWPYCVWIKGKNMAKLMDDIVADAQARAWCMIAKNADGTVRAFHRDDLLPAYSRDGTRVQRPVITPVYLSLRFSHLEFSHNE